MADRSASNLRRKLRRPVSLPDHLEARDRLDGLKRISQYLKLSEPEVSKLRKLTANTDDPMPLFKLSPERAGNARWSVFVDELDAWLDRRSQRDGGWGDPR